MAAHATRIFQPSQFKRTMNCPGWGNLCKNVKPKPSSKYANEGTVAHKLGETCLEKKVSPYDYVGGSGTVFDNGSCSVCLPGMHKEQNTDKHFTITDEMAEAVKVYVDHILAIRAAVTGGVFETEKRFNLEWLVPGMFGTGDHVTVEPLGTLYVDDYKHGAGVAVEVGEKVGDNPQLSIYALGALGKDNADMVEEVQVSIIQPRAPHPAGSVRSITYDVDDLYTWARDVLVPAAKAAQKPNAHLKAGDWCKWCDGLEICPEVKKHRAQVMFGGDKQLIKTNTPISPEVLTGEELDRALAFIPVFEDWAKSVQATAYKRLEQGDSEAPSLFKLVPGKLSNRAWLGTDTDIYNVFKTVLPRKEVYVPETVKSPAQLETALKKVGLKPKEIKEKFAPLLAKRTPGKPSMVPVSDPRAALPPAAERMFGGDPLE